PYLVKYITLERADEQVVYADGNGRIITTQQKYDDDSFELISDTARIYDGSGNLVSCSIIPDSRLSVSASLCGGLAAFVVSPLNDDGTLDCTLLLCYVGNEPLERNQPVAEQKQRAAGRAYELGVKYGITILTGSSAMLDFPDFSAESEYAENRLLDALDDIETALAYFPDGFFAELLTPIEDNEFTPTSLTVCLTGKLRPLNEYSTNYPIAYSYTSGSASYIVIDVLTCVNNTLIQTVAHETMHIIDEKILWLIDKHFDGFGKWTSLVPDDAYNYSYVDNNGNDFSGTKYTPGGKGTTYFIDTYSRTFPKEDRARLFEYLFISQDALYDTIAENEHIRSRAAVLCGVLREAFESVRSCDDVWWERFIKDEIPNN
ncbi:MAG TPA: hypothetical protein PLT66_06445, partial [Bacillota bacterium]|nr:hypothetical protein [Bacillota bacterium]